MDVIDEIRAFNRFYTPLVGLVGEQVLRSGYNLAEMRVLYEVRHMQSPSAAAIAAGLRMDPAYLSRVLKRLKRDGLVTAAMDRADRRRSLLKLTAVGEAAMDRFEAASRVEIGAMVEPLAEGARTGLAETLGRARRLLGGEDAAVTLRAPAAGDIGWVIHRQAVLYAREYGWDASFEALVAQICGDFVINRDPARERAWVADRAGEVVGSVFCIRDDEETAKLRLLYVEPSVRGTGTGAALVDACIGFAREAGYRRMVLWTQANLVAARRIYAARGFALERTEPHLSFGQTLTGEYWALEL